MENGLTHYAFQSSPECLEIEVDYVVVGSGAGGGSAAVTLARGGRSVAVVEAGAWRDPEDYPFTLYGAFRDLFDGWGASVTMGRALSPVLQARTMGGTTVINSAIVVRTPGDIFDLWVDQVGLNDPTMAKSVWTYQDQIEAELSVCPVPTEALGRSNELALQAAENLGIERHVIRRNVKGCFGHAQCLQGCRSGRKQSTNVTWIPEVRRRGGTVLSCAPVTRLMHKRGHVRGVEGRFIHPQTGKGGSRFKVRSRRAVIVAASVTHSPMILWRSGLKSPALGKGFRAHPGTATLGSFDEPVDMTFGATQGMASTHFRNEPGLKLETLNMPLELIAGRLSGAGTTLMQRVREYRHLALWVAAVRAQSVGSIRPGFGGKPQVFYTMNREDMIRLREGSIQLARLFFSVGAKAIMPGVHGLPYALGPDQLHQLENAPLDPRAWTSILTHLFGGCTMGADPRSSVCDFDGKVYGTEGLYVADASIIPSVLGVNPQHTIMALARRISTRLMEQNE